MLVKEIVYMVLDLAKANTTDDSFFTEDHVVFLLKKYRSFLLKKELDKQKSTGVSEYEEQQICLDLEKTGTVSAEQGASCAGGQYLRTTLKMPKVVDGTLPRVYPLDYYQGARVSYVSKDKMRYIGTNRFLKNILYTSLGSDQRLYLKSSNPQFAYLKKIRVSGVFEDFDKAAEYQCDSNGNEIACDVLDKEFPIRDYLVPTLIELVVKELTGALYKPTDDKNNASDDLSKSATK